MLSLSIISAVDRNRNIGLNGDMPWGKSMKADLRRFKQLTDGKTIVMGRKTFMSLPGVLKNRRYVVISRDEQMKQVHPGSVFTFEEALDLVKSLDDEVFVIGGAEIYKQFLPYVDRIYITKIHAYLEGDTKFPDITGKWDVVEKSLHPADENNPYPYEYITYERG